MRKHMNTLKEPRLKKKIQHVILNSPSYYFTYYALAGGFYASLVLSSS